MRRRNFRDRARRPGAGARAAARERARDSRNRRGCDRALRGQHARARHLGRGARGLARRGDVGNGAAEPESRCLRAALRLHRQRALDSRAHHRKARRRERALHDGRSIPAGVTELIVKAGLSYLLGSIVGSLLIGRLKGGVDIRALGSGNAGATNALRTLGRAIAFWVLVIDLATGFVATRLIAPALLPGIAPAAPALGAWCVTVCALAVLLGHVYPLWFGLRGGKGGATLVRSEEHTSELQPHSDLVCSLLL